MDEENVIMRQLDQAYAATCPQWWGANGRPRTCLAEDQGLAHDRVQPVNVNRAIAELTDVRNH